MNNYLDKTIIVYDVSEYFFNDKIMAEMNNYLYQHRIEAVFDYPHIGGGAQKIFEELIVIGLDWAQGIGVNILYDILKYSVKYIVGKMKNRSKKPKGIYLMYEDNSVQFLSDFDLNDDQLEKVTNQMFKIAKTMISQNDKR